MCDVMHNIIFHNWLRMFKKCVILFHFFMLRCIIIIFTWTQTEAIKLY